MRRKGVGGWPQTHIYLDDKFVVLVQDEENAKYKQVAKTNFAFKIHSIRIA